MADTTMGRMLPKGTLLSRGEEIIRTSFDATTAQALQKHFLGRMKDLCNYFVREQNPDDKVEFIRADYKRKGSEEHTQILMGTEGDCDALVVQEYKVRDLRVRPKEQKDIKGYNHVQKNFFFPSLDKN